MTVSLCTRLHQCQVYCYDIIEGDLSRVVFVLSDGVPDKELIVIEVMEGDPSQDVLVLPEDAVPYKESTAAVGEVEDAGADGQNNKGKPNP